MSINKSNKRIIYSNPLPKIDDIKPLFEMAKQIRPGLKASDIAKSCGLSRSMMSLILSEKRRAMSYDTGRKILESLISIINNEDEICGNLAGRNVLYALGNGKMDTVIKHMKEKGYSYLPVLSERFETGMATCIGSITDRDIMGLNIDNFSKVSEFMGPPFHLIDEEMPIHSLPPLIVMHGCVLTGKLRGGAYRVTGIITAHDLL